MLDNSPVPVPDSPENPFWANVQVDQPGDDLWPTDSQVPVSPGEESFPEPSLTSSMSASPISQNRNAPGATRHGATGQSQSTGRPAVQKKKKKKAAQDVWTFFEETEKGRLCVFCQYVNLNHLDSII